MKENQFSFPNFLKFLVGLKRIDLSKESSIPKQVQAKAPVKAVLPTATPMPTPEYSDFEKRVLPTFDKYGIPREVAMGIANAEGGVIGGHNVYNLGAYDSNPNAAINYESPEQSATAAAKLLNGTFEKDFIGSGKFDTRYKPAFDQYKKTNNSDSFLKGIQDAGYAGDPSTWKQRSVDTGGAGQHYDFWNQFVKDTNGWKKWKGKY